MAFMMIDAKMEVSMVIRILRWIGAVILPFPAYVIVCFIVSGLVEWWIARLAGGGEIPGTWIGSAIIVLANFAGGHVVPWTAASIAPADRFVTAVAVSSVLAFELALTLLGNVSIGDGWRIATNVAVLAGLVVGCGAVYAKYAKGREVVWGL